MDKDIKCASCGEYFIFTEGEQYFFSEKGFSEPKRCSGCRLKKKAEGKQFKKEPPVKDKDLLADDDFEDDLKDENY